MIQLLRNVLIFERIGRLVVRRPALAVFLLVVSVVVVFVDWPALLGWSL